MDTSADGKLIKKESLYEEGALKVHKLTAPEVIFTIVGCGIGSGCLGTAYAARLAGFPVIATWLIFSGILTTISMLYIAEAALRTRKLMQLPGLAEKYIGPSGKFFVFLAVAINSTGCMIAYFSGSGDILNQLLGVPPIVGTMMFLIPAAGVSWFGLKAMGMGQKFMSIGMIVMLVVLSIASLLSKSGDISYVVTSNWKYAIPVFNVAAFSYIGQYLVPDLARGLSHEPKKLAPAMIAGMTIVAALLIMIVFSVMYIQPPENISQVATIAWGEAIGLWAFFTANIFALIAMMTSYWAISGTYLTNIVDMFNFKSDEDTKTRLPITIFIIGVPFALAASGLVGFVNAIYFAGTFAGAIMAILPILMLRGARKSGDIEPEWTCGWIASPIIQVIIVIAYAGTAVYAVLNAMGILQAGW